MTCNLRVPLLLSRLLKKRIKMENYTAIMRLTFFTLVLNGCAAVTESAQEVSPEGKFEVLPSFLAGQSAAEQKSRPVLEGNSNPAGLNEGVKGTVLRVRTLTPVEVVNIGSNSSPLPRELFVDNNVITVAADSMPLKEFIHYIFGELLGVNYVLDASFESESAEDLVSLSLVDGLSSRELFDLVSDLLSRRGVELRFDSDVFFILRADEGAGGSGMVIGIGADPSSVPKTSQQILQVVPLKFGIKLSLENTIRSLVKAKITPDFEQSALFIEGRRDSIIQALDLVKMLDTPAMRGKFIALIKLDYLNAAVLTDEISVLLKNEGIDIGIRQPLQKNLVLVPLDQLNGVVVFATNTALLERVVYWTKVLDVPNQSLKKEYFIYSPRYARAVDLGATLTELISGAASSSDSTAGGKTTGNAPSPSRSNTAVSNNLTMVIDKTANALIFYAEAAEYQSVVPLMRRLDVMPRQVMLDITIAEVSLKDEFKYGVEWATQRGDVSLTTQGAFGAMSIGGIGLSIDGIEGPLDASFLGSNSLVNILSNPSIMVRDGFSATIQVGSDVSVIGATTIDPLSGQRQTTTSEYRKTGVNVSVQPTINAQGIVSMSISQQISNSVPGTGGSGGNPDIFERSLRTEVVANNGQTVMLGGLISENKSIGGSGVPGFSKIPFLGSLFKSESDSKGRTELIMLITPRVIENFTEWDRVKEDFSEKLKYVNLR